MKPVKTQVAAAVAALSDRETLEANLSPAQVDACEEFVVRFYDEELNRATFVEECKVLIARAFPKFPDWAAWKATIHVIKDSTGPSGAMSFRNAMKAKYGKLPTAGKGKGSGTKGVSIKREAQALETEVGKIVDRLARIKACDINGALLAMVGKAVAGMVSASTELSAAVNE